MKDLDLLRGSTISEEYGWFCVRNETGWLLWSCKIDEIPAKGLSLLGLINDAARNVETPAPANPKRAA